MPQFIQQIYAQMQKNLSPQEMAELHAALTPRIIQLWLKAFPQLGQMFGGQQQPQGPNPMAQQMYQNIRGGQPQQGPQG